MKFSEWKIKNIKWIFLRRHAIDDMMFLNDIAMIKQWSQKMFWCKIFIWKMEGMKNNIQKRQFDSDSLVWLNSVLTYWKFHYSNINIIWHEILFIKLMLYILIWIISMFKINLFSYMLYLNMLVVFIVPFDLFYNGIMLFDFLKLCKNRKRR